MIAGLVAGIAVGLLTEYYTATFKAPVGTIVEASKTGAGDHHHPGHRGRA